MNIRPMLEEDSPNPRTRLRGKPVIERLMYRTAETSDGCWIWRGSGNPKGYGHIRSDRGGPLMSVHRVAYEFFSGPIPDGLEVDHTCSRSACVNPDHLEAITHAENVRRGRHNQNHEKTECIQGHPLDEENTYITPAGTRSCRTCSRLRMRGYRLAVA